MRSQYKLSHLLKSSFKVKRLVQSKVNLNSTSIGKMRFVLSISSLFVLVCVLFFNGVDSQADMGIDLISEIENNPDPVFDNSKEKHDRVRRIFFD